MTLILFARDVKLTENQLALSGIVSIFQIWKPPSKPILNVLLDAFFTIALGVLYVLVLVLSSVLRRQIAGVYANMFCLVAWLVLSPLPHRKPIR